LVREQGPTVVNWFVTGHDLPDDHWYFRQEEGGRVLANLSHWIDYLYHLIGPALFPVRIVPARGARSDANVAVSYLCGDGSLGVITFSEMGHAFEGVREQLRAHKGNLTATLGDFRSLEMSIGHRRRRFRTFYRDQGHRASIVRAYRNSIDREPYDQALRMRYVESTAHLFLQTKIALDNGSVRLVEELSPVVPAVSRQGLRMV
jgi:predicted dehydrogenase